MVVALIILASLALTGVVAAVVMTMRDGYSRVPTREF